MRFSNEVHFTASKMSVERPARLRGRQKPTLPVSQVELLFDNFAAPAIGTRSAAHLQRHLLYRAAPYELDLLCELVTGSNRLKVTGQLLDSTHAAVFRRGVRVTLWNFRQSFVTLRTNEWGEFLGEIEDSGDLMVSLKMQMREIVISIRNVLRWPDFAA